MRNHVILSIITLVFCFSSLSLKGQNTRAKAASQGFSYEVYKSNKDSIKNANRAKGLSKEERGGEKNIQAFQGLEFLIPKTQFVRPQYLVFKLKRNGKDVLQKLVEEDLLSGAMNDSTGIFDQDKNHFIFNVEGIRPQRYTIEIAVFQADGNVFFINKEEEDLWQKSKKAKSKTR